ncbi:hypothetical protein CMO88_02710 [Candidatus Woesearchaeota archaeon]|nr:hypothetical protein [Candidatus Woesearchaeota archaeon]
MGSGVDKKGAYISKRARELAYELGKEIAKHNCILVNGACRGIPYIASKGAKDADGMVIGVSPAQNYHEHIHTYKFPTDVYDILFYTGFGFKGRNVVNVSNCDAIIVVSGHVGTLNEFTIAYDDGMIIGVMQGSGGIADFVDDIIKIASKKTGATLIYDKEEHDLVRKIIHAVRKKEVKDKRSIRREHEHKCYKCK